MVKIITPPPAATLRARASQGRAPRMVLSLSGPDGRLAAVRAHFDLNQQVLAILLGTTQQRLHAAEAGTRALPYPADLRLRTLLPLLPAPAPDGAEEAADPVPDLPPAALADATLAGARYRACLAAAVRLRYQLAHQLPARAAWARARLAAATALPAALATAEADAPLPPPRRAAQAAQWALLLTQAEQELAQRSGPAPCRLLRARLAGLLAEAEVLAQALAG